MLTRNGMGQHLPTCSARNDQITAIDQGSTAKRTYFHLQVQDLHSGDYWLQLEMVGSARLSALDEYLRTIWLECCEHLSQFETGLRPWRGREIPISARAGQVFRRGVELTHIYDFGTSSYTTIKVLGERRGHATTDHALALMARNDPPESQCSRCQRAASWLCMTCFHEDELDVILCQKHADEHTHEEDADLMPVANSPRVGLCGYMGPAEPPF